MTDADAMGRGGEPGAGEGPGGDALASNLARVAAAAPERGPRAPLAARLLRAAADVAAEAAGPAGARDTLAAPAAEIDAPTPPPHAASRGAEPEVLREAGRGSRSKEPGSPDAPYRGPGSLTSPTGETQGVAMKLQACPKCGAKFDVSSFAKGQQFSCGACGQVVTAHAEAAPAISGRVPGSRSAPASAPAPAAAPRPGGAPARPAAPAAGARPATLSSPKGPQFRPPERHQEPRAASAASTATGSRERRAGRERGEERHGRAERAAQKKSPLPLVLAGGGGLVILIAVIVLAMGGDKDKGGESAQGPGTAAPAPVVPAPPPKAADTVESLRAEMAKRAPQKAGEIKAMAKRFAALGAGVAQEEAKALYRQLVETADPNDAEARAALGFREFNKTIPEAVSFLKYPFLEAVEEANRVRWFDDEEELNLALAAWKETEEHAKRLMEDQEYRAADQARANIAQDPIFKDYNYETIWARPYLICYSSQERLSPYDLLKEKDKTKRKEMLAKLEENRKKWEKVLQEKARLYQQLYQEWMKRFGESLGLKDLMDPYGGRPDYPQGVRSFQDGRPLIIWIFTDRKAFTEHHAKVNPDPSIHPGVAGYFSPQTGWVYLFDNDEGDRQEEIDKNLHEGTHQLEYWFTRQRNRWKNPPKGQDFFGEGIAEWIGSGKIDKKRNLEFTGVNYSRWREMQGIAAAFSKQNKEYKFFPLERLVGFTSYGQAAQYGINQWGVDQLTALLMFYEQSYSLVYWLNEVKGGKHKEQFNQFFAGVLSRDPVAESFKRAFKIRDEEDWIALDEEFHKFMREDVLKRDLSKWKYAVPKRDDWGS